MRMNVNVFQYLKVAKYSYLYVVRNINKVAPEIINQALLEDALAYWEMMNLAKFMCQSMECHLIE